VRIDDETCCGPDAGVEVLLATGACPFEDRHVGINLGLQRREGTNNFDAGVANKSSSIRTGNSPRRPKMATRWNALRARPEIHYVDAMTADFPRAVPNSPTASAERVPNDAEGRRFGLRLSSAHVSSPRAGRGGVRPLGRGTAFVVARHLYGEPQVEHGTLVKTQLVTSTVNKSDHQLRGHDNPRSCTSPGRSASSRRDARISPRRCEAAHRSLDFALSKKARCPHRVMRSCDLMASMGSPIHELPAPEAQ